MSALFNALSIIKAVDREKCLNVDDQRLFDMYTDMSNKRFINKKTLFTFLSDCQNARRGGNFNNK